MQFCLVGTSFHLGIVHLRASAEGVYPQAYAGPDFATVGKILLFLK